LSKTRSFDSFAFGLCSGRRFLNILLDLTNHSHRRPLPESSHRYFETFHRSKLEFDDRRIRLALREGRVLVGTTLGESWKDEGRTCKGTV